MKVISILVQRHNEKTGQKEWALISKKSHKVLKWFGKRKPSEEAVKKEERRIWHFKTAGSLYKELYKILSFNDREDKMMDFVKRCFNIKSPYGSVEDVLSVYDEKSYIAVDLKVLLKAPEGENIETVYYVELNQDGIFHLMDFNVNVDLGSTPEEAANSMRIVLEEGFRSAVLRKKK